MNKYILIAIAIVLLVPAVAHAESDENITKRRPDNPAQIQVQEIRQEAKSAREEIKTKMDETRSQITQNHAVRLTKRFNFYYTRLSNIFTRFDSRLLILEGEGKNVGDARAKLVLAKAKLEEAKTAGSVAIAAFIALDPTKFSEQKTQRLAARDLALSANKLFQEAHTLLKDALKLLKTISKPALPAASAAVQKAE